MSENTQEEPVTLLPKTRKCLRCREAFESEWAGERICPRCKSSQAWKSGTDRVFG